MKPRVYVQRTISTDTYRVYTAETGDVPALVLDRADAVRLASDLMELSASGAGVDRSQPIIQELRKLPRYWMHIPNAAASSTQVVCWVDVQRVIDQSAGVDRHSGSGRGTTRRRTPRVAVGGKG